MAIYNYTAGSDPSGNWTDDANAWDGNASTYAYTVAGKSGGISDILQATANNAPGSGGNIATVNMGIRVRTDLPGDTIFYVTPFFNGLEGSEYTVPNSATASTEWVDITNDAQAPGDWAWLDVQQLDIEVYIVNNNG